MRIAIIATVERLAAHFAAVWLLAGVNTTMLLEMLRIDKRCATYAAFKGAFARMCRLYMIVQ